MKATFGMGCFWHSEAVFKNIKGVKTKVGYMGGQKVNPTYKEVCSGQTGHTEVVQLDYDPKQVTYQELVQQFFSNHDPTQLGRQGPDVGYQYRSVIFYHSEAQKRVAEQAKRKVNGAVTSVEKAGTFYPAEGYHQDYYGKGGSCYNG